MFKAILTTFFMIAILGMASLYSDLAYAERRGEVPVSNKTAAEMYASCMVTQDNRQQSGSSYDRCCSKQLGYCIKCPKTDRGTACVKSPYRIIAPADLVPSNSGDTLAPVKNPPKRQLQGIFKKFKNNSTGTIAK